MFDASHLDALDGISFVTDSCGIILAVGARHWNAFARANGAPELTDDAVVGRSIFDFIAGRENRAHLKSVLRKLASGLYEAWTMPYGCDAPTIARKMRLSVTPLASKKDGSAFLFQSIELNAADRPPINLFDFAALETLDDREQLPMIVMCSWCQRIQHEPITGDKWVLAEEYYAAGGRSHVRISHGICETCLGEAEKAFKA